MAFGDINSGNLTVDQFNDVIYFFKIYAVNMFGIKDTVKLLNWISRAENKANSVEGALNGALDKINSTFGPAFSSRMNDSLQNKFSTLTTSINTKITESGEGTPFSEAGVDLLDLLNWMAENGGGEGNGFTNDELDLINTITTNIMDGTVTGVAIDDVNDLETTKLIKLIGIVYDDLLNYVESNDLSLETIRTDVANLTGRIVSVESVNTTQTERINTNEGAISNLTTDLNTAKTDIETNKTKIGQFEESIKEVKDMAEEMQEIQDNLIYSLNETRILGENINIITETVNDVSPTVKFSLYYYKDKLVIDIYDYSKETDEINKKIKFAIDNIETYVYMLNDNTIISNIKTYFRNNEFNNVLTELLYSYIPCYYFKNDFIYGLDNTKDDYGSIKEVNNYPKITLEELTNHINTLATIEIPNPADPENPTYEHGDLYRNIIIRDEDAGIDSNLIVSQGGTNAITSSSTYTMSDTIEIIGLYYNSSDTSKFDELKLFNNDKLDIYLEYYESASGAFSLVDTYKFEYDKLNNKYFLNLDEITVTSGVNKKANIKATFNGKLEKQISDIVLS